MTTRAASDALKRPTIRDVAASAGVSRGTVSRFLNGGHYVSQESRTAIEAAIKLTGYQLNLNARALATGRSGAVAFLISEPQQLLFEDPVFAILLRNATEAAAVQDLQLVLMMAGTETERRRVTDFVTASRLDGVLLVSSHRSDPLLGALLREQVPTVTLGVALGFEGMVSSASTDDRIGGRAATEYLLGKGYRRIASITGPPASPGGLYRYQGYREALGEAYDERLVVAGDYARSTGYRGMAELLDRGVEFDAVFAHNDLMASGAIELLDERGLSVPGDIAVMGFDDSDPSVRTKPALTTMRQPFERLASEMVRLMLEAIDGGPPTAITLPAALVERDST
ncbi:MAG: LacI family transcriptional regulator [Promicromonosporaceae bacterium]|nr:LacI family transcriptional regulator [Promicromonosporaceae bacterium]